VRPERIRMSSPGQAVAEGEVAVDGTVHEVLYLGADTRYVIALDGGGSLVATRHNLGPADELATPGLPVQLAWRRDHAFALSDPVLPAESSSAPESPAGSESSISTITPGGTTT
jgi:putative spermidine/putrescine transport system ATP-binding protein